MKAAVTSGKGSVDLIDVPVPKIGENEILVRMRACGICGTDLEKVRGEHITPPVLGHEVAGEIDQIGSAVIEFKKGERVAVHHHVSCKNCFYCKNGLETLCEAYPKSNLDPCGLAEYFRVPETLVKGGTVHPLPDSVNFESGSQIEPMACCIRALKKAAISAGESVAVFGVGPAGLAHVQLCKLQGSAPIFAVDIIRYRRDMAEKLGADFTLDPTVDDVTTQILKHTDGRGIDNAIVATGSPRALETGLDCVRKGGKVLLFGAPPRGTLATLKTPQLFLRETIFLSSYSTSETEMRIALRLIESKRIDPSQIITHRLPLNRPSDAFSLADKGEALKIIIQN